ncbi:N-acetylmuramoyl-L-alanine amidase [Patescibacteria group bacterium]|nr:N-acetylmuramoyl-L-alanine amidase [Patescibacteria group bacterium]
MRRFIFSALIIAMIGGAGWYGAMLLQTTSSLNLAATASTAASSTQTTTVSEAPAPAPDPSLTFGSPQAPVFTQKPRILIIPGHEPDYGGAQFGSLNERDMTAELGVDLQQFLDQDPNYQAFITRSDTAWNPTFANYFTTDWNAIVAWEAAARKNGTMLAALKDSPTPAIQHNAAEADVALRLYGVTKWADENNIDLMIHIHFNDYPGHPDGVPGEYSGVVIYTPAAQYDNSSSTQPIAQAMLRRLALYNPIDDLPIESTGIVQDPELIAIGANNTAKPASMLIEYNYIYEPQFVNSAVRSVALKDLAYQTYLGLQDFYTNAQNVSALTNYFPANVYRWTTPVSDNSGDPNDVYALQTALIMDGDFPPAPLTGYDCPHSGFFGTCTQNAVQALQAKYGITGEDASGPHTFALLQKIYNGEMTPRS